ncbi:uncharacterized protein FTOL_03292 [Fusarium torulosum]|uniref:Uncharacterized protein n=1 Tax=Fusarium torulosum TaxID=33205 RepID=A0AAE8SFJ2_9HYPO|nr:uncharacterized protein FTOL_03292 [Fusarium torulosum]
MPSLHDLDGQMSHMMISDNDMDDNSSECSYYSLPDLEDDPWLMQIPAYEVRKQAEQVPEAASPGAKYPHPFYNKEKLKLQTAGPWLEYPLCLNGRYHNESYRSAGPARVIVNPSVPGGHDVIYHPRKTEAGFRQAIYHKTGYRKKLPGCTSPMSVASPSTCPSPDLGYLSPPASPDMYGGAVYPGYKEISPEQAFAFAVCQQQWTGQDDTGSWSNHYLQNTWMMASPSYPNGGVGMNQYYYNGYTG